MSASCHKEKATPTTESVLSKQVRNAIWCYYESNFMKHGLSYLNKSHEHLPSNLCFTDGFVLDTVHIKDTLEFYIYSTHKGKQCIPVHGLVFDIFGFYKNSDTVCYRGSSDLINSRKPYNDSITAQWEWMGIYPMKKQRVLFKQFIIENRDSLNDWLQSEAKRRKYIY
jgi:hypothetical protein